ncbi:MAG: bestrophin family ion channel, partial [Bradyrhizobium sp.]
MSLAAELVYLLPSRIEVPKDRDRSAKGSSMIVRPRPTFLQLFFVMRGSVVPRILPQILGFALYSAVILVVARWFHLDLGVFNITPFGLVAVTLSIYLS